MLQKIFGLVLGVMLISSLAVAEVTVGTAAPDFRLPDTQGKEQSLADYKGKFVVLEWFNHGCPFVKKHYDSKNMQTLQKDLTAKGVVWFSIISSAMGKEGYVTADQAQVVMQGLESAASATLLDPAGTVGRLYGAQTTPHMFIINPEGLLIYQGAIDNIPSADPADTAKATNYVSQALEEALAGKAVSISATKSYGCSVKY